MLLYKKIENSEEMIMNSVQQSLRNFTDINRSPVANMVKAGARKVADGTKAAAKRAAPYALAGTVAVSPLLHSEPVEAGDKPSPFATVESTNLIAANIPSPRSSRFSEIESNEDSKSYRSLSENPVYKDYKENVVKLVDEALPQDIPLRDRYIKLFSNATTDLVFKGPESFKTKWEYSNYINGIFEKAYKSFKGDVDKFDSMTTTVSYLQGTRASEGTPSRRAVFSRQQLDRLFDYPDYNQSIKTIGSLNDGMETYKLSPEVLRTKYSDRYIDKYLVTSNY